MCSRYVRTAAGCFFVQCTRVHQHKVHAVRTFVGAVQKIGAVGTCPPCSITFCFEYSNVGTSAMQFVGISVRSTCWTAVGTGNVRTVGTYIQQ